MAWLDYLAWFFGGVFLANTIPHLVAGISGRAFQSPFAKPPGVGLSSSTLNVVWGLINLAIAYLLLVRVGSFDIRELGSILPSGVGFALMALALGNRLGRFHGGNSPPA
jgi:hypothetical protein